MNPSTDSINNQQFEAMIRSFCKANRIRLPPSRVLESILSVIDQTEDGMISWDAWVHLYAQVRLVEFTNGLPTAGMVRGGIVDAV